MMIARDGDRGDPMGIPIISLRMFFPSVFFYTNFIAQTCEHVRTGLPGPRGAGGWPVLPPELTPAAVLHDDPSKSPLLGLPNVEAVPIAGPVLSSLKVQ